MAELAPEELKGLIDDFVLEEIYYRKAVAMGVDRDDTVIRRLRQKLEFLTDGLAAASVPMMTVNSWAVPNSLSGLLRQWTGRAKSTLEQLFSRPLAGSQASFR